jgi:hypothetical protein
MKKVIHLEKKLKAFTIKREMMKNKILEEVKKEIEIKDKVNSLVDGKNIEESTEALLESFTDDQLKILESIEEATTAGMQMRSYESKKNAAIGAIAVSMAKKNKDPLYDRLKHFRGAWKHAKNEILQRYYSQATQRWQAGQN